VYAAVRQLEAADRLAADTGRWDALPPALRAAGALRRAHPDAALESLAVLAGISRPAMAGRLRRLVEAADA
jgi:DNA-binding transcriptional regulator WhiA